jgi:hypothetical protein
MMVKYVSISCALCSVTVVQLLMYLLSLLHPASSLEEDTLVTLRPSKLKSHSKHHNKIKFLSHCHARNFCKCSVILCFNLVQLTVQYSMLLKSLLAQHVSDVTASTVRGTTVCTVIGFFGFWCVYSVGLVMVLGHIVTVSRSVLD